MKFDFSWFTTIPGILITCGVVLLIIALVIFIVTSRKNKKVDSTVSSGETSTNVEAVPSTVEQSVTPIEIDNTPLQSIDNTSSAAIPTELPAEPIAVPEPVVASTPVVENAVPQPIPVQPESVIKEETIASSPVTPMSIPEPQPTPVIDVTPEVLPTVQPEPVVNPTPVVEPIPVVNEPQITPVQEVTPVSTKPSIYGGVSEIIPNINIEKNTESHQIYGGADPLENTQTLKVTPSEPTVQVQPVVTEQPQVTIPSVNSVTSNEPVVNVIPTVEEVIQQPSSTSDIDSLMP